MRRSNFKRGAMFALVALFAVVAFTVPAEGSNVTGTAGTDSSLPLTESKTTVSGRGDFSKLKITINQTKNLVNQAVSITWEGGEPTIQTPQQFSGNYLQLMQCWGDDDGTHAQNPGPPPTQCAQGARNGVAGGVSNSPFPGGSFATDRILTRTGFKNYDSIDGVVDEKTKDKWLPFKAVNGTTIGVSVDTSFNPTVEGGVYWQNPFYNVVTTNEIAGAMTLDNGTGAELFEVVTGIEDAGLGCGQHVETMSDGSKRVPKCWLVIVPRGAPEAENEDTPYRGSSASNYGVMTSPVAPAAWDNRIAVPLEFNDVDSSCDLTADSARIAGSELAQAAISSWQPALCKRSGSRPFSFGVIGDTAAIQQMQLPTEGTPGMFVLTKPLPSDYVDPDDPVVYAPLSLSGLTIGFNFERVPSLEADVDAQRLRGVRATKMNLTPRLLAKLLTQSYRGQLRIKKLPEDDAHKWVADNPEHMGEDEDFRRFNPEWNELYISFSKNFGSLLLPGGSSDAIQQVWNYILADPEAKRWLEGEPDEWGMRVNPVYAAKDATNSTGTAFTAPDSFPKSEPYCYQSGPVGRTQVIPPPLCGTDWVPYVGSFRDGARLTRAGDDTSKTEEAVDPPSPAQAWKRTVPQPAGRTMMTLTDTPSANQFGLQMARLSRAGDNDDSRAFVAPTAETIAAGVNGMVADSEPAVLRTDPLAKADGAYPLSLITYAAIRPLTLTQDQRNEYASFIDYAAGAGQSSGLEYGQLPVGYSPLSAGLQTQSVQAAKVVRELTAARVAAEAAEAGDTSASSDSASSSFRSSGSSSSSSNSHDPALATTPLPAVNNSVLGKLKKVLTPAVAVPGTRFALPALLVLALLAGLGALEVTKRPRRGPGQT